MTERATGRLACEDQAGRSCGLRHKARGTIPRRPGARLGELPRPLDGRVAIVTGAAGGLASSWTALGKRAVQVREILTEAHDTRGQWEVMTEPTRRMARAADVELKRRGV